ncbi:hypothetical protein D3C87_625720 [compost metagenome]
MENILFKQIIGTWSLVELIEIPVSGGAIIHPMGKNPKGLIIYNSEGYMSAQIMERNRKKNHQEPGKNASPEEYTQEGCTYLAYSGRFKTDDKKQMVSHMIYVSLFSDWVGQMLNRIVLFKDEFLHLESEKPFTSNSRLVTHKLIWKRA